MNSQELILLSVAGTILLLLIIYSLTTGRRSPTKTAASQAESLKNMLNEYAQNVEIEEQTIDKKFEFLQVQIPTKQYPLYDSMRAVTEMDLTIEEVAGFVLDLIAAIDAEIPRMEEAILKSDYATLEEITHTLTGTSSTLGSGGISSAFICFYASVQHRDSIQEQYIHLQNIKFYLNELKEEVDYEVPEKEK